MFNNMCSRFVHGITEMTVLLPRRPSSSAGGYYANYYDNICKAMNSPVMC